MDLDKVRVHHARGGFADKRDVAVLAGWDPGFARRLGQHQAFLICCVSASRGQGEDREGRADASRILHVATYLGSLNAFLI